MTTLQLILRICGLVCWLLAALAVPVPRLGLVGLGLFLYHLGDILP